MFWGDILSCSSRYDLNKAICLQVLKAANLSSPPSREDWEPHSRQLCVMGVFKQTARASISHEERLLRTPSLSKGPRLFSLKKDTAPAYSLGEVARAQTPDGRQKTRAYTTSRSSRAIFTNGNVAGRSRGRKGDLIDQFLG